MLGQILRALLLALVAAIVIQSLPDLKRYMELRQM
jgi:hypothetical protein